MPRPDLLLAAVLFASLVIYALTGGADFGGGFWDLFCRGPRAGAQRRLIAQAIGPVWETNHIWLIIAVVILFAGYPKAFAALSTALFVPLTLFLAGIVLRGAAFAFHAYHLHAESGAPRWGKIFAAASLLTPVLLGMTVGALSSGRIAADPRGAPAAGSSWLAPYPISVGLLTLAAFAYLAASYLSLETEDPDLRNDFRLRAMGAGAALALLSLLVPAVAARGAPEFHRSLMGSGWFPAFVLGSAVAALGAFASLALGKFRLARAGAAVQVVLLLGGFGLAQYPHLVRPGITVSSSAASPAMLRLLLGALAAGGAFLFPAVGYLFRVFKRDALLGKGGKGR